jgi:hypothetical protein
MDFVDLGAITSDMGGSEGFGTSNLQQWKPAIGVPAEEFYVSRRGIFG